MCSVFQFPIFFKASRDPEMDLAKLTLSQLTVTPNKDEMSRLISRLLTAEVDLKKPRRSQPVKPSRSSLPQIPLHSTRFCVIARSAMWLSRGAAWFRERVCAARFRVPISAALRAYRAAQRDSGRQCAPRHAVIGRRDAIPGAGARRAARLLCGAV